MPLLEIRGLCTYLRSPRGKVKAVDGVSVSVAEGKIRALVGESGSGKSMTALSIMQLLPEPAGYVESGSILFEGQDLLDLTWSEMRGLRGSRISMIFQEPMTSLNPAYTIGNQVREAALVHGKSRAEAADLALHLLERVGIENPTLTLRQYPHELSGGMRQRVMIAIALTNKPRLLIADEPTTALDVTVQAQILALIRDMQREFGMAVLLITHDLAVVAEMADDVSVMYAGQIVEDASVQELFKNPRHPYTQDLFESLPGRRFRGQDLAVILGRVPEATDWPMGCRYAPRCRFAQSVCIEKAPAAISNLGVAHTSVSDLSSGVAPTSEAIATDAADFGSSPGLRGSPNGARILSEGRSPGNPRPINSESPEGATLPRASEERRMGFSGAQVRCHRYDPQHQDAFKEKA